MADPSTETWRATFAASGQSTSAQLRRAEEERDDAVSKAERMRGFWQECSRHRDEIKKALAASQADLSTMQQQRDEAREMYAEASNEARVMRKAAEQYLEALAKTEADLATARYQNRRLTAENEAALRRLNEKEGL